MWVRILFVWSAKLLTDKVKKKYNKTRRQRLCDRVQAINSCVWEWGGRTTLLQDQSRGLVLRRVASGVQWKWGIRNKKWEKWMAPRMHVEQLLHVIVKHTMATETCADYQPGNTGSSLCTVHPQSPRLSSWLFLLMWPLMPTDGRRAELPWRHAPLFRAAAVPLCAFERGQLEHWQCVKLQNHNEVHSSGRSWFWGLSWTEKKLQPSKKPKKRQGLFQHFCSNIKEKLSVCFSFMN